MYVYVWINVSLGESLGFHLLQGVVEVEHFGVELGYERLQAVDGVEDLDAFCVRVEPHFEGSGHGRHPASARLYHVNIIGPE